MNQEQNNLNNMQGNNMIPNNGGIQLNSDINQQMFNQLNLTQTSLEPVQPMQQVPIMEQPVQVQSIVEPVQVVQPVMEPQVSNKEVNNVQMDNNLYSQPQMINQNIVQEPVIQAPIEPVVMQEQSQEAVQLVTGVPTVEQSQVQNIMPTVEPQLEVVNQVNMQQPVMEPMFQQQSQEVPVQPIQPVMPEVNTVQTIQQQPQVANQPNMLNNQPQNINQPLNTENIEQTNVPNNEVKPPKKKSSFLTVILVIIILGVAFVGGMYIYNNFIADNGDDVSNAGSVDGDGNLLEDEAVNEQDDTNEDVNDLETSTLLTGTYKVPGKEIVVDVPNWQEIEKGFTQLYILHDVKYIAITAEKNSSASTLQLAHEDAFNKFKENIQNYSYVNSLNVINSSEEVINDINVYKYEGTLNCGHDVVYDAYVIGYSFIIDNTPCTIVGSVIDKTQEQGMIDEITEIVDAMMKTVRSER